MENSNGGLKMEDGKTNTGPIRSFQDLVVYQNLYKAMLVVHKEIIPNLPPEEKDDLCSQMRRASKAPPALLAEGFAKRYKEKHWKKYLEDSQGEANEMIHHLSICIDLYPTFISTETCRQLIETYDIACKQLTNIIKKWKNYHENS
jgi:four helix bundle protein